MYVEEISSDELKNEVLKSLKAIGVKHHLRKFDNKPLVEKRVEVYHVFKTSLELLEKESVHLIQSNVSLEIPVFVVDSCRFIEQNLVVEGLFRKAGSTSRQRELRALLDCGNRLELDAEHHVINVANILKLFFRELPEPLIPFKFHDTFLRCLLLKVNKIEGILLTCLLLPPDHRNTLAYLMQFLNNVAANSEVNKMDVGNLSIIFTPSIMPLNAPKLTLHGGERINHHVQVVKLLIENAQSIGVVPERICDKLGLLQGSFSGQESEDIISKKKKKKKRSSSLTRMLGGLKKMMAKSSPQESELSATPDFSRHTPQILSAKKRKAEPLALSSKKKVEVLNLLPQGLSLASTPCTPPKCKHASTLMLSPRVLVARSQRKSLSPNKMKKMCHSLKVHSLGHIKRNISSKGSNLNESPVCSNIHSPKFIELPKFENVEHSCDYTGGSVTNPVLASACSHVLPSIECSSMSEEYVRIPKVEYEAIKDRVSQIESRIENELENLLGVSIRNFEEMDTSKELLQENSQVKNIQCVYAKTIEQSERLNNSGAEHLTRKLSRELKIRRSSDQCIIRSPSARKIGTIRRRSRENVPSHKEINQQRPLNQCDRSNSVMKHNLYITRSLRRGRPNTVFTGLPQPSPLLLNGQGNDTLNGNSSSESSPSYINLNNLNVTKRKRSQVQNKTQTTSEYKKSNSPKLCDKNEWMNAKEYFISGANEEHVIGNRRESIAKIRSQNVGMVLAKAKLFDALTTKEKASDVLNNALDEQNLFQKDHDLHFNSILLSEETLSTMDKMVCSQNILDADQMQSELTSKQSLGRQTSKCNDIAIIRNEKENYIENCVLDGEMLNSALTVCSRKFDNNLLSPLKDCNRSTLGIPSIKQTLNILTPHKKLTKTPNSKKSRQTPLKPLHCT